MPPQQVRSSDAGRLPRSARLTFMLVQVYVQPPQKNSGPGAGAGCCACLVRPILPLMRLTRARTY